MIPSLNTFIHYGAQLDSHFEEKGSLRKCENGQNRCESSRWPTGGTISRFQLDQMSTIESLPSLKGNKSQISPTSESLPRVCGVECEHQLSDTRKDSSTDGIRISFLNSYLGLRVNAMKTLGTVGMPPSGVCDNALELESFEPVHLKNTFIDFDDLVDPDHELSMREKCLSDPGIAQNASFEENSSIVQYGATLRSRAARLREMLQSASASQEAYQVCSHKDKLRCDTTPSQERDSIGVVLTEQHDFRDGVETMASPQSLKGTYQAQFQPELLYHAVTTLMVCNLPCKLSAEGLTNAVNELGFEGLYDLIYVPRGAKNLLGYGFVNFIQPEAAARFSAVIGTYKFPGNTKKQAYCKVANYQGVNSMLNKISRGRNYRRRAQVPVIY